MHTLVKGFFFTRINNFSPRPSQTFWRPCSNLKIWALRIIIRI